MLAANHNHFTHLCSFPLYKSCRNCLSFPGVYMSLKLGNKYMWRNESIAINGRSDWLLPRWCRGCANRSPSATKKLMLARNSTKVNNCQSIFVFKRLTFLAEQLIFHHRLVVLDRLSVAWTEEQDQERQPLLCELLGILEGDLAHQWNALLQTPFAHLVHVGEAAGVRLVVLVRNGDVGSEHNDWRARWVHLRDDLAEADVELTVLLQVCGDSAENVVLRLIPSVEIADDDSLLIVQRVEILETRELLRRILELLLHVLDKRVGRSLPAILLLRHLPVPDDLQRRVLGDVILWRDRRLHIAIDLGEHDLAGFGKRFFHFVGRLVEDWLQQVAEPTPVGVEIDYD